MKINGYEILTHANLRGAYLRDANLYGADPKGADLEGTCLAGYPGVTPASLEWLGWEVRGGWVYGVRTARSMHIGLTEYTPGQTYEAPYLSTDSATECHPGIYMLRDINAARDPDALVFHHVVQEAFQTDRARGVPDEAHVQSDRHHFGGSGKTLCV